MQKIPGNFMDAFNIEKRKIHLKHEPRGNVLDINGWPYGNFSYLGQEKIGHVSYKSGRFVERTSISNFLAICFSLVVDT